MTPPSTQRPPAVRASQARPGPSQGHPSGPVADPCGLVEQGRTVPAWSGLA